MDDQLEQAVSIALQGTADSSLRQQALEFCNQVRDSEDGWQLCLALFTGNRDRSQEARFFALQVIDSKLPSLSPDHVALVKDNLFAYISKIVSSYDFATLGPSHMRNKLAQTLGYLFVLCYMSSWTSYFEDFGQLMLTPKSSVGNSLGTDLFLRVLRSIHEEIGETIYSISEEKAKRNNLLKDCIRQKDMAKLAQYWLSILQNHDNNDTANDSNGNSNDKMDINDQQKLNEEIVEGVLKVVGGWVSWMDISLIVTPPLLNLIFCQLTIPRQRITACDTISEIVLKKMKAGDKLELIGLLNLENLLPQLPGMMDNDLEFAERIAKLTNIVSLEALHIFDGSMTSTAIEAERAEQVVNTLFPVILNFLSNEYDDVSQQTFSFISEFLQLLRRESREAKKKVDTSTMQKNHLGKVMSGFPPDRQFVAPHRAEMMKAVLEKVIVVKMKYDEDDDWEDQQEDGDDDFLHFRDKLKVFLDHVASTDIDLYLEGMSNIITQSLTGNAEGKSWQDVELSLYLLFHLGESIKNANAASTRGEDTTAQKITNQLFLQMIQSDVVLQINHPAIQKWYIELAVRHAAVFTANDLMLVNKVLSMFVSPIGVHNTTEAVRVRSWYLFYRFVKQVKNIVGDIGETVFNSISDLLTIHAKFDSSKDDSDSDLDADSAVDTVFSSQLYLFELCGLLVVHEINQDSGVSLTQRFLQPLYSDIERCLQNPNLQDAQNSHQIHHNLYAIGTFIRGFSDNLSGNERPKATSELKNITQVVSVVLDRLSAVSVVRDGARMVYIYLVPLAGLEILSSVTQYISVMLNVVTIYDVDDFLGFLGQMLHKFKGDNGVFEMFGSLIGPLISRTLTLLEQSVSADSSSTDAVVQQEKTRRSYLQFLYNVLNNGMGAIFLADSNRQTFQTVLESVFHFASECRESLSIKLAVTVLNKMLLIWGTGVVTADPPESDCFCKGMELKNNFSQEFVFENYTRVCWQIPSKPWFNHKDFQSRNLLAEVSLLQKTLIEQKGSAYAQYLAQQYLPSIGVPQEYIVEYIKNLEGLKAKEFKRFFTEFVSQMASR